MGSRVPSVRGAEREHSSGAQVLPGAPEAASRMLVGHSPAGFLADSRHPPPPAPPDLSTDRFPRAGLRQAWRGGAWASPAGGGAAFAATPPISGQATSGPPEQAEWWMVLSGVILALSAFPGSGWFRRRSGPAPPIESVWRRVCDRPRTKHGSHGATWATNRCRGLEPGCAPLPSSSKVLGLRTRFRPVQNGNDSEGLWLVKQRKKLGSAQCRAGHGGLGGPT